jgi:hypothetical protein
MTIQLVQKLSFVLLYLVWIGSQQVSGSVPTSPSNDGLVFVVLWALITPLLKASQR